MSVFQDSDRNDKHPVLAAIRILPYARKNHQERKLLHPRRVYHAPQLEQAYRADDRRGHVVARVRHAYGRLQAQVGIPCGYVLDFLKM